MINSDGDCSGVSRSYFCPRCHPFGSLDGICSCSSARSTRSADWVCSPGSWRRERWPLPPPSALPCSGGRCSTRLPPPVFSFSRSRPLASVWAIHGRTGAVGPARPHNQSTFHDSLFMEVILRQAVENLGSPGDVVKVSNGYARTFLLPRGIAFEATPGNLKRIAQEKERLQAAEDERRTAAQALAAKLEQVSLTFSARVGEEGKL